MNTSSGRKKLWQIASGYHCAIIGTCLGRRELRQIKRKKVYGFESNASDFEVHNRLSGYGDAKNEQSRMLHKFLDTRYAAAIKRYAAVSSEEELLENWGEDCREGNVSGAFWAIMSHPLATGEIQGQVYGDCHMLSFDHFSEQRNSRGEIKKREEALRKEESRRVALEHRVKREIEKRSQLREQLTAQNDQTLQVQIELRKVKLENERLERQLQETLIATAPSAQEYDEGELELEIEILQEELQEAREEIFYYRSALQADVGTMNRGDGEMFQGYPTGQVADGECVDCEGCSGEECPAGLCGKMILYVGGHHKMVARYRELVEKRGGRFAHHDGGRENSRQRLPQLLSGADVVLCPVDCVSHDACKRVKKICKQYCKPFRMMRSSGVSALERELEAVA